MENPQNKPKSAGQERPAKASLPALIGLLNKIAAADPAKIHTSLSKVVTAYTEQIRALLDAGVDAIGARDAFYGAQIGSTAAEPFIMRATLHLGDPLAHLRTRPGHALLFEVP